VLNCTKGKLNQAILHDKAKIDANLKKIVLNCTKSNPNQAINNINTKAGNLELKIDVPSAC
jgi:hypothetical protein